MESNRNNLCSKVVETKALVELLNIADISSSEGQFINNIFKTTDGVTLLFHSLAKSIWDRNLCSYKGTITKVNLMSLILKIKAFRVFVT